MQRWTLDGSLKHSMSKLTCQPVLVKMVVVPLPFSSPVSFTDLTMISFSRMDN